MWNKVYSLWLSHAICKCFAQTIDHFVALSITGQVSFCNHYHFAWKSFLGCPYCHPCYIGSLISERHQIHVVAITHKNPIMISVWMTLILTHCPFKALKYEAKFVCVALCPLVMSPHPHKVFIAIVTYRYTTVNLYSAWFIDSKACVLLRTL